MRIKAPKIIIDLQIKLKLLEVKRQDIQKAERHYFATSLYLVKAVVFPQAMYG